jgi:uncharacterized protein YdeI (BOF family)
MKERRVSKGVSVAVLFVVLALAVQTWMPAAVGGAPVRGAPDPGAPQLLLTEIVVTPTEGEFIEIFNPTGAAVDLSNVYLTDATFPGGPDYYYKIVTGVHAGGEYSSDFHVRFPEGAIIAPGAYQTIALPGSNAFFTAYGVAPTYELREDGASPDAIPDMRLAFPGSMGTAPGLSNDGEVVILYYWDGQSDLVTDLDYVVWGDKLEAVDKTGVAIDGPDADAATSTYLPDTAISAQGISGTGGVPHTYGNSIQRKDLNEGAEVKTGGNGAQGHNETSENLSTTWGEQTPTPNAGLTRQTMLLLTEIVVTPTGGEFVEIYNPTDAPVELGNVYLTDATYRNGNVYYYNIVTGVGAGGGTNQDFNARFPEGATIARGAYQTIALPGSGAFFTAYGVAPTYELREDGASPDAIPDMRPALPGSIASDAGLSNAGEIVILYYWDGQSDLVTDLDYVVWGDKDEAVDKTGVAVDGPDADAVPSTYLPDIAISAQAIAGTGAEPHAYGKSSQRRDLNEGTEVKTGGNGATGHNETSENLNTTWGEDTPTPGTGGAPSGQPKVVSSYPASNALNANPYFAVEAVFDIEMSPTTINATNFTLQSASGPVAGSVYYDSGRMAAVLKPNLPLAAGALYTATVKAAVAGKGGTPLGADYKWSFATAAVTFSAYHGSLHNHTGLSDGTGTPAAAFTAGKARGLDFMALADHSQAVDDAGWADTLAQANSYTVNGTFVALRGTEYTQGSEGHINIFDTVRRPVRSDTTATCTTCDFAPALANLYTWLAQHPEAVGQFNHPGWMNFNDWGYRADAEPTMQLTEVGNGAYGFYVWTEEEYLKALDYGWRVGPTNNGDTHSDEWGMDNPGRSGIWATELTYDGVLEAMAAMRVFATEDGNLELYLKGDGAWMGQTIPNDGNISFEVYVKDPDTVAGDGLISLALYTDQGQVVTSTVPAANPYTWTFALPVSVGVHYYFARAEQVDGDRAVSAPIWTQGNVDVSPTKLEIAPAQLSTLGPASFKARVTNRGAADAMNVTVNFKVGAAVIGSKVITVPMGADAFATIGWTPNVTGLQNIAVEISGVPAGDNLDDNRITVQRYIVDYPVPLIVIDNGHSNNVFQSGDGGDFKNDLVAHGLNWVEDTDGITAADLATAVLLVISDPGMRGQDVYTNEEEQAIADYVNNGGALLIAGDSDYGNAANPEAINTILGKINGTRIRMNSDGTQDDTTNSGVGPWGVLWHNFPGVSETGIGVNVDIVVGYSGCSIYGVDGSGNPVPLTTGNGVTITVQGDDDTYQFNNDTVPPLYTYTVGTTVPMAAVQVLPGGGRIAVWGDSDESFSNSYTYVPSDGYQNEIYNMESIYWLLGRPLEKWTVAKARADAELNDTPDHRTELVWVEGTVTAAYRNFYDVLYVQDGTGGITVYAPVAGVTDTLTLGTQVRVVGRVEIYQGDTEIQIDWDPEQIQIIGTGTVPDPLMLSTHNAALEGNEGWLVQTAGRVIQVISDYSFVIDDGSGPVRVFIDGYNGTFAGVKVSDWVQAIGLASEDSEGQRIRVRKQADVIITPPNRLYLPLVFKTHTR